MLTDPTSRAAEFALDALAQRRRLSADNVANGMTPGFRAQKLDFEASLSAALASGDPAALRAATADAALAIELLASVNPLTMLALLTASRPPDDAELLYSAAPLGVGYLVASWRWASPTGPARS